MPSKLVSALLAVLPALSAAQYNDKYAGLFFAQDTGAAVSIQRLDPIMSPGTVAGHVHSIVGTNAFGPTMDFAKTQEGTCSTMLVKPDKSIYWFPSLYFQHPQNGSFIRVPEKPHHKIYYFNRAQQNETIEEFPKEFRMLAGDPNRRSLPESQQLQRATEWMCHDPNSKATGFPKGITKCGYGYAGSIHYPHCWNGKPFDINNPRAHMSYPMGNFPDSGYCPPSHPHVMPHIFVEFWFDTKSLNGLYTANDNPWVLANGDPTGFSFHGDFINGWEPGVLKKAMETCRIGVSGRPLTDCFPIWTPEERKKCVIEPIVKENIDGWMQHLPGCNPIQAGPAPATPQKCDWPYINSLNGQQPIPAPATPPTTGGTNPAPAPAPAPQPSRVIEAPAPAKPSAGSSPPATNPSSPGLALPIGWTSAGCHTDKVNPRSLRGVNLANIGAKMTTVGCVAYCDKRGFKIAGTEYAGQCFCGNELLDSQKAAETVCNMPCEGDKSQICDGAAALSLYEKA